MMRRLLKSFTRVTDGGISLPPGIVMFAVERQRIQRLVVKVAQGLHYLNKESWIPAVNCNDIRFCHGYDEVPEVYRLSWREVPARAVIPAVFSYRWLEFEDVELFTMLFWETVMCCAIFTSSGDAATAQ